jgi:hypothetical protein
METHTQENLQITVFWKPQYLVFRIWIDSLQLPDSDLHFLLQGLHYKQFCNTEISLYMPVCIILKHNFTKLIVGLEGNENNSLHKQK